MAQVANYGYVWTAQHGCVPTLCAYFLRCPPLGARFLCPPYVPTPDADALRFPHLLLLLLLLPLPKLLLLRLPLLLPLRLLCFRPRLLQPLRLSLRLLLPRGSSGGLSLLLGRVLCLLNLLQLRQKVPAARMSSWPVLLQLRDQNVRKVCL